MKTKNYSLWIFLAAIPLIAFSKTLEISIYSSLVLLVVMLITKGFDVLLENRLNKEFLPFIYLILVAVQVTIIQLITNTFASFYNSEIALYLSVLVVNLAILIPSSEQTFKKTIINTGVSILFIVVASLFREVFGTAMINISSLDFNLGVFNPVYKIDFLQTIPGGLLIAGIFLAVINLIYNRDKDGEAKWSLF